MWTSPKQESNVTQILGHILNKIDTLSATLTDEKLIAQAQELKSSFQDLIAIWPPKSEEK